MHNPESSEYNPDELPIGNDRCISIDPAFGSSNTGITITDIRDDRVAVLYSEEFDHSTSEKMVDLVWDLYHKYYPVSRINVDSSQISFIKSLKQVFLNEFKEEVDYERQIKLLKDSKADWRLNLRIQPVFFSEKSSRTMLVHSRDLLQKGWVMIDKRFDKLLIALHSANDQEGRPDKKCMSDSDCWDAWRMCLSTYGDFTFDK